MRPLWRFAALHDAVLAAPFARALVLLINH
jgi:hypothetical protein